MVRKLTIDGQVFQTPAWHRGMGKYSLELLGALLQLHEENRWDSMELILSGRVEKEKSMLDELKRKLPGMRIVYLDLMPDEVGNGSVPLHNRKVIDTYIDSQAGAVTDFLVLSLMQGGIYPVFPSVPTVQKLVIFYDLIPLMFHEIYLRNSITRHEYLPRVGELLRADKYLAISKTVANDLAIYLGVDKKRIVSIDGGPINHSKVQKKFPVAGSFILMPTGNDLRKNNRRAIIGFDQFNQKHGGKYTLVITSFFKDHEIDELSRLSDSIYFTGNVSGEELSYLYENATALLFPPEYEGLGMPILEALEWNKPVACSNIAVFREMSKTAFNYFDPQSVVEISNALDKSVKQFKVDIETYKKILSRYTWQHAAEKLVKAAGDYEEGTTRRKPRIAIFGPDPGHHRDVGKVMQESHGEISREYEVDYFIEPALGEHEQRMNYLPYITATREIAVGFALRPEEYEAKVYHLGNGEEFARTLLVALGEPGIVVLHDTVFDKTWDAMATQGLVSSSRTEVEDKIEKKYKVSGASHLASLLASQQAVIVFDEQSGTKVRKVLKLINIDIPVRVFTYPVCTLVYNDALSEKTVPVLRASDNSTKRAQLTDFRYNEQLQKTSIVVFGNNENKRHLLEIMRFGAVPCVPAFLAAVLPPDSVFTYANNGEQELENVLSRALKDSTQYQALSNHNLDYMESEHNQRRYASNMAALITETKGSTD